MRRTFGISSTRSTTPTGSRFASSSSCITARRIDPGSLAEEGQPPPKAVYVVCDRPVPASAADTTLDSIPRILCQAILFGRETDREARLEIVGVESRNLDRLKSRLAEAAGPELGQPVRQEAGERLSRSLAMLHHNWRLPQDSSPEQIRQWIRTYREDCLLNQWPNSPLGLLEGKTPREAAADPNGRARVLGAILLLEFWTASDRDPFDFNRLRSRLGLPVLEPIDPEQTPIHEVPLPRLYRVVVEKLKDEDLLAGFHVAASFGPARRFALSAAGSSSVRRSPGGTNGFRP